MNSTDKTIFIGCGTGRCGTTSLKNLVNGCTDVICEHERRPLLPWEFNENRFLQRMKWFSESSASLTGDVAHYYLPYLEKCVQTFEDVKIICLERDRQDVIESFMWKTHWRNSWTHHDGSYWVIDPVWDSTFPKYDISDKAEAIGKYWDEYHLRIRSIAGRFPGNVQIFDIDALNRRSGQESIFDFLNIPENHRQYRTNPRYNARKTDHRQWTREESFQWMQQVLSTADTVMSHVPGDCDFILIDQEQIRDYITVKGRIIPFPEKNGKYWGLPADSRTAIHELERMRRMGFRFIAITWPAIWWLKYYSEFHQYLETHFNCLFKTGHFILYQLNE